MVSQSDCSLHNIYQPWAHSQLGNLCQCAASRMVAQDFSCLLKDFVQAGEVTMCFPEFVGFPGGTPFSGVPYRISFRSHDVCDTSLRKFFGAHTSAFVTSFLKLLAAPVTCIDAIETQCCRGARRLAEWHVRYRILCARVRYASAFVTSKWIIADA